MAKEDEIKVIAYDIWEQQGCPDGHDCEQWFMAEKIWEQRQKAALQNTKAPPKADNKANPKITTGKK
jgi:hypothetical protein